MSSDPFEFIQAVSTYVEGVFRHRLSEVLDGTRFPHPPVPLSFTTSIITDAEIIADVLATAIAHTSQFLMFLHPFVIL